MALPAETLPLQPKGKLDPIDVVRETHTEELVIALCGPIGSGHREVVAELSEMISRSYGYEVRVVKISTLIAEDCSLGSFPNDYERIRALQEGGNQLRQQFGAGYLALRVIDTISLERESEKGESLHHRSRRVIYIIDSIKNPEEYRLLQYTYRGIFYCLGVYSPIETRKAFLQQRNIADNKISELIDIDSGEEIAHGQQVTDAFVHSDFFMRIGTINKDVISSQLQRYLSLLFGSKIVSPTPYETAMHHASVAGANSACLSRQVGAALIDANDQLISVGWNDVPKFGGGLYQSTINNNNVSENDHRCVTWQGGKCFNDAEKRILGLNLFEEMKKAGLVVSDDFPKFENAIKKTKIRGLIEFSRSIHAEMHAILNAIDQEGYRVKGGKLFVTTYPCHSCARHIVAAGINEVYFIEPYRKSMATKLHGDSITENELSTNQVRILPYSGVSPKLYLRLFTATSSGRKDANGNVTKFDPFKTSPVIEESIESIPIRESLVVAELEKMRGTK